MYIKQYPHYLESRCKYGKKYHSKKPCGQIYDSVIETVKVVNKLINTNNNDNTNSDSDSNTHTLAPTNTTTNTKSSNSNNSNNTSTTFKINPMLTLAGSEVYDTSTKHILTQYNHDILLLMYKYNIRNESELLSGYVTNCLSKNTCLPKNKCLPKSNSRIPNNNHLPNNRLFERVNDIQSSLQLSIINLKNKYISIFYSEFQVHNVDYTTALNYNNNIHYNIMLKAASWYYVTYTQEKGHNSDPFLSFAWLPYTALCKVYEYNMYTNSNDLK